MRLESENQAQTSSEIRAIVAGFRRLLIVGFLVCQIPAQALSQVGIPQTNLGPVGPGFQNSAPGSAFGPINGANITPPAGVNPNTIPRIRSGQASLFDPYAGGRAAGNFQPAGPPVSITPITPGAFGPGAPITSGQFGNQAFGPGVTGPTISAPPGTLGFNGNLFGGGAPTAVQPPNYGPGYNAPLGGVFGPSVSGNGNWGAQPPTLFGQGVPAYNGAVGGYPNTIYPNSTPSTLFPEGLFRGGLFGAGGAGVGGLGGFGSGLGGRGNGYIGPGSELFSRFRFVHGPRFRHTFINASDGTENLETNDSDISVAFALPNFLYSNQPLYVAPSFSIHLWDGPVTDPAATPNFQLPENVYSAFLDFGWQTDPNRLFGLELGVRVGAFTEFEEFRGDSLRIMGKGLASFRLTPATTFKAGVYYLDRRSIKLLPAVGWLWQPNPFTRADIFIPQPKYARYWRTLGTNDVWWYLSGDYGGGSWTLRNDEAVDINDLRVMAGFEWGVSDLIRAGRRSGFFEFGYVFDREVVFERQRQTLDLDDGFMVRVGFGY